MVCLGDWECVLLKDTRFPTSSAAPEHVIKSASRVKEVAEASCLRHTPLYVFPEILK